MPVIKLEREEVVEIDANDYNDSQQAHAVVKIKGEKLSTNDVEFIFPQLRSIKQEEVEVAQESDQAQLTDEQILANLTGKNNYDSDEAGGSQGTDCEKDKNLGGYGLNLRNKSCKYFSAKII